MKTQTSALILVALAWLSGCATSSQPPSGRMADVTEARATVAAMDREHRILTLQDEAGAQFVAEVPPNVPNLDQVQVGDQIVISYTKALAWQVRAKGQQQPAFSAEPAAASQSADKLKSSVGQSMVMTGKIAAIDTGKGTVTLAWPDGTSDTIKARDPANLKKVKVGDIVDINYSEAVAVALRPAAPK